MDNEACGIVILDKPAGFTSMDAVNVVRRAFDTKRVGHTGTLDPMATGVLVVLVGRAAKAAELVPSDKKTYRAVMRLGLTTDTEDITGKILTESDDIPDAVKVIDTAKKFEGEIEQIPPMYSALKVGGRKLVDIARKGGEIERKPRPVTVFSLECIPTERRDEFILEVECSGGTYIRTLCADIGRELGCGGVMAELRRTAACGFGIDRAVAVDELRSLGKDELKARLIPLESLFSGYPEIVLPAFYEKLFRSGCEIYQKKIKTFYPDGTTVRVCGEKCGFFALGKVGEFEGGSAVKSIKLFSILE